MIFALAMDDGGLLVFPTETDAVSHCEGIDVEDRKWLFYSEDGSPLEARFERPNRRGRFFVVSGTYALQRAVSGRWLQERLAQVKTVDGCGISTIAGLVELLKVNRGKRIPIGVVRG